MNRTMPTEGASAERRLTSIINRLQGLADLAADNASLAGVTADRLLGCDNRAAVGGMSADTPVDVPDGDLDHLNVCLDQLESRLRDTGTAVHRLTAI